MQRMGKMGKRICRASLTFVDTSKWRQYPLEVSDGDGQFTLPIPLRNYSPDALRRTGPCVTAQV